MATQFAGILGLIAFAIVVLRSVIWGAGVEGTIEVACISLVVFAGLGWCAGRLAQRVVDEGVETVIQEELAKLDQQTD